MCFLMRFSVFIRATWICFTLILLIGKNINWIGINIYIQTSLWLRSFSSRSLRNLCCEFLFLWINLEVIDIIPRIYLIRWSWIIFLAFFWGLIKSFSVRINFTNIWNIFILWIITFASLTATLNWFFINFTELDCCNLVINFLTLQICLFLACQRQFSRDLIRLICISCWINWFLRFDIILNILANLHSLKLQG